jgi:hypothetical protein
MMTNVKEVEVNFSVLVSPFETEREKEKKLDADHDN